MVLRIIYIQLQHKTTDVVMTAESIFLFIYFYNKKKIIYSLLILSCGYHIKFNKHNFWAM